VAMGLLPARPMSRYDGVHAASPTIHGRSATFRAAASMAVELPTSRCQITTETRRRQHWVGDTTEMLTSSGGKFYLAALIALYARYCVGWGVSPVNDRHLTSRALEMAIRRRCPQAGLLHHTDQGSTYASDDYQDILAAHGITCSMSRRGNCLD